MADQCLIYQFFMYSTCFSTAVIILVGLLVELPAVVCPAYEAGAAVHVLVAVTAALPAGLGGSAAGGLVGSQSRTAALSQPRQT